MEAADPSLLPLVPKRQAPLENISVYTLEESGGLWNFVSDNSLMVPHILLLLSPKRHSGRGIYENNFSLGVSLPAARPVAPRDL